MEHEPPLHTSTDDIVASGRRQRSRRRLGVAGIGAVTVVAAGLVAAATVGLPHFAEADTPAGTPAGAGAEDRYPVVADWEEYSQVVRELFAEQRPDLEYLSAGDEEGDEPFELDEWGSFHSDDPAETHEIPHSGMASLRDADDRPVGNVSVSLYEPGDSWDTEPGDEPVDIPIGKEHLVSCWSGEEEVHQGNEPDGPVWTLVTTTDCQDTTAANGDRMILSTREQHYEGKEPETLDNSVVVFRADGTAVVVTNFCGNGDEDDEYGGTCHATEFTVEQLSAIAEALPAVIVTDDGH